MPLTSYVPTEAEQRTIFISYDYQDRLWQERIRRYLTAIIPENANVTIWDDTNIKAGSSWADQITRNIDRAEIALLLISPNYLTNEQISNFEIPHLRNRAKGNLRLVPILINDIDWDKNDWLKHIFFLPRPLLPLATLRGNTATAALRKVAKEILSLLLSLKSNSTSFPTANLRFPTPLYLLSLTIENIKCFSGSQTIRLSDHSGYPAPWTVILGNNGVGKTTLLRCLAAIDPTITYTFLQHEQFLTRNSEILHETSSNTGTNTISPLNSRITGSLSTGLDLNVHSSEGTNAEEVDFWLETEISKNARVAGQPDRVNDLICYGYGAARMMSNTALSADLLEAHSASLFSDEIALPNAEEWLLQCDYAANVGSNFQERARQRLEKVKSLLTDLLPDVDGIRVLPPNDIRQQGSVEFKTPYGWVTLKQLSLGYRTLTAWMVDLARRLFERYPYSPNPIAEPAIVLVDEIDLHLHPQWQRKLMDFLTHSFPKTQFIVTAHSPLVVQAAARANIVLLRQEGDHVEIVNDAAKVHGWRVDQLLTSDLFDLPSSWGPELDPLLQEREAILSKGVLTDADRERLEKLAVEIGELPTGETRQDVEAMDIIREAAALIKASKGS